MQTSQQIWCLPNESKPKKSHKSHFYNFIRLCSVDYSKFFSKIQTINKEFYRLKVLSIHYTNITFIFLISGLFAKLEFSIKVSKDWITFNHKKNNKWFFLKTWKCLLAVKKQKQLLSLAICLLKVNYKQAISINKKKSLL